MIILKTLLEKTIPLKTLRIKILSNTLLFFIKLVNVHMQCTEVVYYL